MARTPITMRYVKDILRLKHQNGLSVREIAVRRRQQERFKAKPKITCNAPMPTRELKQYCALDEATLKMLEFAMADLNFSARGHNSRAFFGEAVQHVPHILPVEAWLFTLGPF